MPGEPPERYRWAVDLLDVRLDDRLLEIGCGRGHAIGLVCDRLTSGRLTAIDRSEKMVDAARRANKRHIDSGKVEILHQDLLDSALPPASFNKIFLFNINAFWMDPVAELAEVKRLLKSDGEFFIFHQPPPGHDSAEFAVEFTRNLSANGFAPSAPEFARRDSFEAVCVRSKKSAG